MRVVKLAAVILATLVPNPSFAESIIVKPGDTLSYIASTQKVSIKAIMEANGIKNPNDLQVGMKLILPESNKEQTIGMSENYIVQNGDTISQIAITYKVKALDLMNLNLLFNSLELTMILLI